MTSKYLTSIIFTFFATLSLVSCGGGGGGGGNSSDPKDQVVLSNKNAPWFHDYMKTDDGSEVLVLTTIDQANFNKVSPPTPLFMIQVGSSGVVDKTSTYFNTPPQFYWARNIVAFTDPVTQRPILWFCSQGREVGNYEDAPDPRVNGVWGEQDQLYVLNGDKFEDASTKLPQSNDFSHGCSVGNIGDGNPLVFVKNTLGVFDGNPPRRLLFDDGVKYTSNGFDSDTLADVTSWWTGTGDFAGRGFDDFVYSKRIVRYVGGAYQVVQDLVASDLENEGYTNYHGGVIGDINNDNKPDIIMILSGDGVKQPFLGGAKLAVFLNDGTGSFSYSPASIPSHEPNEYGLKIRIFDINFDGNADIVTSGSKYGYGLQVTDRLTSSVLVGDGQGNFIKKTLNDPALNLISNGHEAMYFLHDRDSTSYSIILYSGDGVNTTLYGRTVTPNTPLGLR